MRPKAKFGASALGSLPVTTLLVVTAVSSTPALAQGTQLPGITIYSTTPQLAAEVQVGDEDASAIPTRAVEDPESPARPPSFGDGGEFLRHVNGVDAGRMGGHGLEPVIRGLDQNQLSITNDGAFHFGGCPNRMDPPTSHMQLYTYDKVIVKRGYQTVLDGPPAPGGSVLFERVNPTFAPEGSTNLKFGTAYNSNGNQLESFVDMSVGNHWGFIRGFGSYAKADNYDDGSGNEIRSSFEQFGGGIILGRTFDADSWISLKVENNNVDDALFPGAGMDAPLTDDWTYQLKGETNLDWGIVRGVKGDIYLTTVYHVMNNFDLRTPPAMGPAAHRNKEARMDSDTLGGKVVFDGAVGAFTFDAGVDYRSVMRDGNRYAGTTANFHPTDIQSILWPDTSIKELGVFGEAQVPLAPTATMTVGLRYAHVQASADKVNQLAHVWPMGGAQYMTPNQLYAAVYGVTATDQTEHNVSGLVRLEKEVSDRLTLFGSLSRAVRTADATERYLASFMGMNGMMSWVGNPTLDPEKHHQVDVGVTYQGMAVDFRGSVFYNSVDDFIQRYSRQNIGAPFTNVHVYRNIDATLAGFEAEAQVRLTDVWRVNLSGAFTRGENDTTGIPLGQIPPLSGRLEIVYDNKRLMAGARVNAAASQGRIDDGGDGIGPLGSNQDAGRTPGWTTVDLFGSYNFTESAQLSAGVTNLFDKTYSYHLTRQNLTSPVGVRVNEPGRSFYVRSAFKF